jgi:multicomponent Na+:H+ antiporter subunit F
MLTTLTQSVAALLIIAIVLASYRLVRGPGLVNRAIALDVMAVLAAALTAVFAIRYDQPVFLDVTMILAVVSFIGTVAFAHFLARSSDP